MDFLQLHTGNNDEAHQLLWNIILTIFLSVLQLGPYLEILKDIMEHFFDFPEPSNEVPVKLKVVFEAMDRPEFLTAVPKVSCCISKKSFNLN